MQPTAKHRGRPDRELAPPARSSGAWPAAGLGTLVVSLALTAAPAVAAEPVAGIISDAGDRRGTAITVYNDDLALVKELRRVTLSAGRTRISLREVAARMRPETVSIGTRGGAPLALLEQTFDFAPLTPSKLLEKYVGREVTVIWTHPSTTEERRERATVLAASEGVVLKFSDRVETGTPGRIAFDDVPETLRDRPTLSVLVDATAGQRDVEISYLTGGLSWRADYVAILAPEGRQTDLSGSITLTNRSGTAYRDALLQFVAGTVNRVREPKTRELALTAAAPRAVAAEMAQEALLDHHLYSYGRPVSIEDNQTKQLALLSAAAIAVRREYRLTGADFHLRQPMPAVRSQLKPSVFLSFDNRGGDLGRPLPAGVIRVYARDRQGNAQFIGEDAIGHTASGESIELRLGEAFDITAERVQTAFRKLADNVTESSHRIALRNPKDAPVIVRVVEPMRGDWEIVRQSLPSTKSDVQAAVWSVQVPAGGATALEYTVRVRW